LDDTPTRERIRLQHRTGTFIEMHPNGDEVHKVYGDGYEITIKDKNILINGNMNITVLGDANIYTQGNLNEQVDGNYELHVKGNYTTVVEGLTSFVSQGDMDIKAGGALAGGLFITPGDYVSIRGDLKVNGEITAAKIFSKGRVDCLTGMSATSGGFTTEFGGISVGPLEAPIPLEINCTGPINSKVSMSAPLITSGISTSFLSKDIINSIIRNTQIHIAPFGPTSPPTTQEIVA
jgi:cytoskeletal protein CcmA (bactofilin family)